MAPFFKTGLFTEQISFLIAFVIGISFGFWLERAGFGSSRKLAAQFYFKDLAVLKVMFTAIITAEGSREFILEIDGILVADSELHSCYIIIISTR